MDGVTTLVKVGCDQARRMRRSSRWLARLQKTRAMSYSQEQCDELWKTVWAVDKENCKRQLGGAGTEHAMRQARWIIEDNWDGIEKVAEALEKHGTLSGEDVAVLLST